MVKTRKTCFLRPNPSLNSYTDLIFPVKSLYQINFLQGKTFQYFIKSKYKMDFLLFILHAGHRWALARPLIPAPDRENLRFLNN